MEKENLRFYTLSSKELNNKSGIYKFSAGGHIYIGSSKNLYARLAEHRTDLKENRHSNNFLQKVYNKYGIENIQIDIVEFCDPDDRINRESFWIKELNADMNLQDPVSHKLSESSKQKLSKSIKKGLSEGKYKTKYDYCDIEAYDHFGNYIKTFKSRNELSKEYGFTNKEIQELASGYKKGSSKNGIRLRYSISDVPVQSFEINPNFIGNHYVFFYINESGEEEFAFSSVKNCWKFFGEHANLKEIKIIPKLRCLVTQDYPGKRGKTNSVNLETSSNEDNPNPNTLEIE